MSAMLALALMQAPTYAATPPATTPAPACIGGLCDAARLRPFFDRLAAARRGGRPVRILQIGDSHTAGDQVTGTWRTLLQARYGSGGRGVLPPGRPYNGYLTRGITARQSDGWTIGGIFGAVWRGGTGAPVGLSGYSLSTGTAGATMALRADPVQLFDRFTVCAMRGPEAGTIAMTVGSVSVTWPLADDRTGPDCRSLDSVGVTADAGISVIAGPVTLTSWSTERRAAGGVTLSNLGTVGAQFIHVDRVDDAIATREIAEYAPDLIVVAFGTNEAFWPAFSAAAYDATLRAGLRRIRRLAPGVPILMLGAPDSATRTVELQSNRSGVSPSCAGDPLPRPLATRPGEVVQPLPPRPAGSLWRPPAALSVVQSIQRARAQELGLAYWDWSARMGGRCTADDWSKRTPPLMRGDHVHFTTPGAAIIATRLQQDIDAAIAALGSERR